MYRDDENKIEDRTEAEREEKNEGIQGLVSEETEKSDAKNTPEQLPVTAQDNYSSSAQPSIEQKPAQNIYGNGQQGGRKCAGVQSGQDYGYGHGEEKLRRPVVGQCLRHLCARDI